MKAILLNGPPRSGKDTIGAMLAALTNAEGCMKFAEPIRSFLLNQFAIDIDSVHKDEPHPALYNRTPREVAIGYSERLIKPLFGVGWFGQKLAQRMKALIPPAGHVFVTDSGFPHEAAVLGTELGWENVLQVVLTRPGKTFEGDSRCHWNVPAIGHIEFDNDAPTLPDLKHKLKADLVPEIQRWLSR